MVILPKSYAIFWRSPDHPQQFHADGWTWESNESPSRVVARFKAAFPSDIVMSCRDGSGRFVAFKN